MFLPSSGPLLRHLKERNSDWVIDHLNFGRSFPFLATSVTKLHC